MNIESKSELLTLIDQLIKLDPFWTKCFPCRNHGICCVGADPSIDEDEWDEIKKTFQNYPQLR